MQRRRIFKVFSSFSLALILAVVIKLIFPMAVNAQSDTLLVGAAASLQNALQEIDPLFKTAYPNLKVNYTFAASGPLQQQIEQGAPIDLFISAGVKQMDALAQKKLITANSRHNLLTNRLVLIVPRGSTLGLAGFRQLTNAKFKHIAMGEPRSVPAGQYAEQVFRNLKIWDQLQSKFVFSNSVRIVLGTVESGNADAGIVYATDAQVSDKVTQVATAPENLHDPIVYPVAIVSASHHQNAAHIYTEFLSSQQAIGIFRQYGFGIAPH